ncbi:MAG TPA: DnaJ domain-containing protein [Kofleriaceae bacterium]
MSELASAVVSITATQRRRFFWAAWWSHTPRASPFRKPDASNGGCATMEDALAEAEERAGRYLVMIDPYWARAWTRVLRGERTPPMPSARVKRPLKTVVKPASAWEMLGLATGASLAEVKAAFRQRALATHPDHGGDADEFRALHAAYERLVSRISRR